MALDDDGALYGWGKGARGQLEKDDFTNYSDDNVNDDNVNDDNTNDNDVNLEKESTVDVEFAAIPISDFEVLTSSARSLLRGNDKKVKQMSAGWNHSAVITESNHAWVWGKNVSVKKSFMDATMLKPMDSPAPTIIKGLPDTLQIQHISCGSHHTAVLMEDGSVYAIGFTTDTAEPIGKEAVQIVPPGLIDMPVRQFESHFDRTTIVTRENGQQVFEVQLWSTDELRESAVFEPEWVETLVDNCDNTSGVNMVQRGWLHTVVITKTSS